MGVTSDPRLPRTVLREWRATSGRSYADLAREVGCTDRTMLRIAASNRGDGGLLMRIAQATGIPVTRFSIADRSIGRRR